MQTIWNARQPEEKRAQLKTRALKGFIWLLLLMMACTLLSRAADSLTMAVVKVERPRQSSIAQTISFSGTLQAEGDIPVTGYAGVMVQSIAVAPGDRVAAGDLLLSLDLEPLTEQIAQKEQSIARKQAELDALASDDYRTAQQREADAERAMEDFYQAMADAARAALTAREDLAMARHADFYYKYATPVEQYSQIQANALEKEVRLKERAVEQAELDREANLRKHQRLLDDLAQGAPSGAAATLLQMDIKQLNADVEALQHALANQKEVYAPMDGIVRAVWAKVGQSTGEDALFLLNDGLDIRFVGEITEAQREYVAVDAPLSLHLPGQEKPLNLSVSSVALSMERADRYLVCAPLPQGQGRPGLGGEADIITRSDVYPACVSLAALHRDGSQTYVLQVVERHSVLGAEFVVQRVNVEVLESNESIAAISAPLEAQAELVSSCSKPLKDGDRVRMGD